MMAGRIRGWSWALVAVLALAACDKGKDGAEETGSSKEDAPKDAASFTGTWKTAWGPVKMTQTGRTITGSFTGAYTGKLDGQVDGREAEVDWTQTNGERGKARFKLAESGDSFTGTWGSLSSFSNGGAWNGKRQGSSAGSKLGDGLGN